MKNHALRVLELKLSDVGPFEALSLKFKPQPGLSLLCGGNGIGKTSILEAIVASFSRGQSHKIKRRQAAEIGSVDVGFIFDDAPHAIHFEVKAFDPERGDHSSFKNESSQYLINIRASRDFKYRRQDSIARDPDFDSRGFSSRVAEDTDSFGIKAWLTNRYLLRPHADKSSWTPQMLRNLEVAEAFFSVLDNNYNLHEVDVRSFDVLVSTPSGIIPFELLSSGFRSAYALLLGIVKEIEFRKLEVAADEFSGVILIDEIDLHLHPMWQRKIGGVLKRAFPCAQIIATTHSPHVVQTAQADEVISLVLDGSGNVFSRPVMSTQYGYLGWTVEEILEEIMGVEDTRTQAFRSAMRNFDSAIDNGDEVKLREALVVLKEMLHPSNPLRKVLEIQSAPHLGVGK